MQEGKVVDEVGMFRPSVFGTHIHQSNIVWYRLSYQCLKSNWQDCFQLLCWLLIALFARHYTAVWNLECGVFLWTYWYDTRCCFDVHSKADMSQLNLTTTKKCKTEKVKTDMLRSNSESLGNPHSQSWGKKERLRWEGFTEKESFKPGMKEWVCDGQVIMISMTVSSINDRIRFYS